MKLKKGVKKFLIWFGIIIGILLVGFIVLIIVAVHNDLKQEDILQQEIINFSNKDLAKDEYPVEVKTTGDYAYVEEAIKKYYRELSNNVKAVNTYFNDQKFSNILSYDTLASDRPNYILAHTTVTSTRKNINKYLNKIEDLCDANTIKGLIDKDKLSDYDYYYEFYLQLMYTEKDKEEFDKLKKEMSNLSDNFNLFLDKIDEILLFLEQNDSNIQYVSNIIYFSNDDYLNKYKQLLSELSAIADNFEVDVGNDLANDKSNEI